MRKGVVTTLARRLSFVVAAALLVLLLLVGSLVSDDVWEPDSTIDELQSHPSTGGSQDRQHAGIARQPDRLHSLGRVRVRAGVLRTERTPARRVAALVSGGDPARRRAALRRRPPALVALARRRPRDAGRHHRHHGDWSSEP